MAIGSVKVEISVPDAVALLELLREDDGESRLNWAYVIEALDWGLKLRADQEREAEEHSHLEHPGAVPGHPDDMT